MATDNVPDIVALISMNGISKEVRSSDFGIFSIENFDNGLYIVHWEDATSHENQQTKLMVAH